MMSNTSSQSTYYPLRRFEIIAWANTYEIIATYHITVGVGSSKRIDLNYFSPYTLTRRQLPTDGLGQHTLA